MRGGIFVLVLAVCVLTAAAWLRGAEYDEQYTLFLTAGIARPDWPTGVFLAGDVAALQTPHLDLPRLARDLRATDVHPPLYFWLAALWRRAWGGGLFTARLLSVALSVVSLALVGGIARRSGIPPARAMLLTLGCYGFAYTGAIARGFALALCLLLAGVWLSPSRRGRFVSGMLLGAATAANYLAVFPAAVFAIRSWRAALGFALFLPLDAWFFLAQRGSRDGQFPAFAWWDSLIRLARYGAAAVFGGLPLYVPDGWRAVVSAGVAGFAVVLMVVTVLCRYRPPGLGIAALATPLGLLALGAAFNTTPIELRYLAFATPFAALLLAGVLPRWLFIATSALQAFAIAGLLLRPETMQPARLAATAAAPRPDSTVALVPMGNDGVGIPGAFGIEAAPDLPILIVRPGDARAAIRARTSGYDHVLLVVMPQDAASRAVIAAWGAAPVPGVVTVQP
jgi:hypothetical protein